MSKAALKSTRSNRPANLNLHDQIGAVAGAAHALHFLVTFICEEYLEGGVSDGLFHASTHLIDEVRALQDVATK